MATAVETRVRFGIRFEGLAEMVQRLRAISESSEAMKSLAGALYARGNAILAVSQRLVPVDTGALRGSGHTTVPKIEGESATCEVVYGGAAAPYARIVHEDLHARHKVGEAKYLEKAVIAERDGTLRQLNLTVKEIIRQRRAGLRSA